MARVPGSLRPIGHHQTYYCKKSDTKHTQTGLCRAKAACTLRKNGQNSKKRVRTMPQTTNIIGFETEQEAQEWCERNGLEIIGTDIITSNGNQTCVVQALPKPVDDTDDIDWDNLDLNNTERGEKQ